MCIQLLHLLLTAVLEVHGVSIPFLHDVFFRTNRRKDVDESTVFNGTCDDCLCKTLDLNANYVALNYVGNHTCQLFPSLPMPCEIPRSTEAQLYFLRGVPSNARQYCMPNITELVNRLKNVTPIVMSLSFEAGGFGYDKTKPSEAVVIRARSGDLHWFNSIDLTLLRNQTINFRLTIALHNNTVFTGKDRDPHVPILDEQTLAPRANITYPSLSQVRKIHLSQQ
jgi:hypothetical protein